MLLLLFSVPDLLLGAVFALALVTGRGWLRVGPRLSSSLWPVPGLPFFPPPFGVELGVDLPLLAGPLLSRLTPSAPCCDLVEAAVLNSMMALRWGSEACSGRRSVICRGKSSEEGEALRLAIVEQCGGVGLRVLNCIVWVGI